MPRLPDRAPLPGRRSSGVAGRRLAAPRAHTHTHSRTLAHERARPPDRRARARARATSGRSLTRAGSKARRLRACPGPHEPRAARTGEGEREERGGFRRPDPAPTRRARAGGRGIQAAVRCAGWAVRPRGRPLSGAEGKVRRERAPPGGSARRRACCSALSPPSGICRCCFAACFFFLPVVLK